MFFFSSAHRWHEETRQKKNQINIYVTYTMSTTPPQKLTADPGRMMVSKLVSVWCSAYSQARTVSFWEGNLYKPEGLPHRLLLRNNFPLKDEFYGAALDTTAGGQFMNFNRTQTLCGI